MYNIHESEVIQSLGHRLVVAQAGVSHASLSMATHRSLGLLCVREQHRLGRVVGHASGVADSVLPAGNNPSPGRAEGRRTPRGAGKAESYSVKADGKEILSVRVRLNGEEKS